MTSPSCLLPMVNRLGKSEVNDKVHERFCDTLKTTSDTHPSGKPSSLFWVEQHSCLPHQVTGGAQLWAQCLCPAPHSHFETLSPTVAVFGNGSSKEITKVK